MRFAPARWYFADTPVARRAGGPGSLGRLGFAHCRRPSAWPYHTGRLARGKPGLASR